MNEQKRIAKFSKALDKKLAKLTKKYCLRLVTYQSCRDGKKDTSRAIKVINVRK